MTLRIGFGEYDITPPLGVSLCGYDKREGAADDLHDRLSARAMVFDDGARAAALVVADVITLTPEQYRRTGLLVEQWTGIPRRHVVAAGTHTHSGPTPVPWPRRGRPSVNALHAALMPDLLASAVALAWKDRRPASLHSATVQIQDLTVNRREPGAAIDPELTVVHVRRGRARPGLLLDFACHGVVLGPDNLALSADWIGQTRAALQDQDPAVFPLVAVAPSGDINPLPAAIRREMKRRGAKFFTHDPFSGIYDRTGGTFAQAAAMGRHLARAAAQALIEARRVPVAGGVRAVTRRADIGAGARKIPAAFRVVRVGDLAIVGMAGEQFAETGLRVRKAVRAHGWVPVLVSHSPHLAYVPTPQAFAQDREHDYEVEWARRMGMAPDAADRELAAIRRALRATAP